jgi:replicative DNA helicase
MTKEQLELRLKTIKTGISNIRLIKGEIHENEWEALNEATEEISGAPIFIDDCSSVNIVDIRAKIINLISKYDIKIVFIDFIQRMKSVDKNQRDLRLITNEITGGLAAIAKDLKIPIVALSQLNRSVESTKNKMPELHHLKESGNIEEDAYAIMFLYRPEYYGLETFADDYSDIESKDKAQVLIAKHRNGSLGDPIISFIKNKMHFEDLKENSYTPIGTTLQAKIDQMGAEKTIMPKGKESDFDDF